MTDENWMEGIDQAAVDKAVSAGEILPKALLPKIEQGSTNSKETLFVKFLENPKKITSPNLQKGYAWLAVVEHQGAKKSMFVPDSLRFNLAKECKLQGVPEPMGHRFVIGASLEDMKATDSRPARKGVKLYWCQLSDREPEAAEAEKAGEGEAAEPQKGPTGQEIPASATSTQASS